AVTVRPVVFWNAQVDPGIQSHAEAFVVVVDDVDIRAQPQVDRAEELKADGRPRVEDEVPLGINMQALKDLLPVVVVRDAPDRTVDLAGIEAPAQAYPGSLGFHTAAAVVGQVDGIAFQVKQREIIYKVARKGVHHIRGAYRLKAAHFGRGRPGGQGHG